jgi:hypothetical protein
MGGGDRQGTRRRVKEMREGRRKRERKGRRGSSRRGVLLVEGIISSYVRANKAC